jgi:hypothetical protein
MSELTIVPSRRIPCDVCGENPAVRVCPNCHFAMCAECDDGEPCGLSAFDGDDDPSEAEICPEEEWATDGFEEYDAAAFTDSPSPPGEGGRG